MGEVNVDAFSVSPEHALLPSTTIVTGHHVTKPYNLVDKVDKVTTEYSSQQAGDG